MARRGRGAELNALRQKKKDEQTGSTKQKSQSSVSSNKNGGGRTGGLTRQDVQQKVSRSAGYTSSGKAKQPSTTQQANPYATSRNIINKSNSSTTQNNARRSRINGSVARGREQAQIDRRQTAATAAEMRRAQENERLSRTSTGRKMLEQRENEKKAKAQTAAEWKDVKKLSTAEQQEWFTKKAQEAQERNALKNNTKVDKGTDNLATSAVKAMGLGAKSAGSSLLGRLERGSLNDTYESAKFKFDAMREGKSESEAQAIGDSKAQKRQEQRLAGLRAITKAAQERTEQIQEQEEAKDRHKINIGGETFSPRKMAVGAASFTGQRITDTVAMGPYSLLGMGARVLEDETNSGKEKADRLKKRLADSGQFSQEELDREFAKIDRRTTANAYASAGIEMLSELMFSGVGLSKKYLPEGATGLLDRTIGKLFGNAGRSAVGRVALGIGEETAEEWIANPIQAAISNKLTGNRLQGLQEESIRRAYQGQAQSLKEAHATAADINSQAFLDRAKEVYKESGANEEEATRIAELARDYFNADLTGDSETAQKKLQQITDILAGGENDLRDKWTLRDALEVAGEMVLSVGAEATPGAISTAQTGGQYKANYGTEGVRKLAKVVENLDTDKTHQAAAIVDDIDKGKDISNTQVAMLMEWSNAAAQKAQDREITRDQVVQRKMRDESLFVPIVDTEYNLAPATAERFEAITERVADLAQDYMGVKMSDRDAYAIGDVVAAYQTGTISAEQMNEINMENPENRAVFERATGINLDQYTVKDRKGNINVAASNTAMQEDLFAKAADNYMKSARLEQENWNDVARGQAYEKLTSNMDGMGGVGIQRVLESVDPRNRDDFMLAGSVARRVYEHARATNDDWNTVKRDFTQAFGADMNESMKYVFDMAKEAKAIAENKYYGKQVSPKSSIGDTVVAEGKFTNESARELKGSEIGVLTSIASELGIDVIMTDALDRGENGRYMSGKRTIMLNAANTMGENLEAIFSHEVTHHLAAYAPEEYIKLSRFVMDRWYKANPDEYNAEIKRIQKLYKDAKNQELSPEEALEELIADGSRDFWQDGELINSVTTEEPSLAKSIINAIKSFLGKLRNMLASGNITDENVREGFFAEIGAYDEAYRLWLTAYNAARSDSARQAIDEWQDKVFEETRSSISTTNDVLADRDDTAIFIKNTSDANYIDMIFSGEKTEETRSRRTLDAYIGKEVAVTDGKNVYGTVVLGEPHKYSAEEFRSEEAQAKHRVPEGDQYDSKNGKWAYPIESYEKYDKPRKLSDSRDYLGTRQARQVRFSITPEQDTDYMSAVERGDMETAQRMVDEAAKAAGYDSHLYSGTDAFGFTQIDTSAPGGDGFSFWATNSEDTASTYTQFGKVRRINSDISEEDLEDLNERTYTKLENAVEDFRRLIDKTFSEWYFGQQNNDYLMGLIEDSMDAFNEYQDDVYNALDEIVYDAYDSYGGDLQDEFEDVEEFRESPRGEEIYRVINEIEDICKNIQRIGRNEIKGGIYELYANTDNMYVFDGKGQSWNALRPDFMPAKKTAWSDNAPYKTRELANWARENGYDGIIFKNIEDSGQYGDSLAADVFTFFNPQAQVKSADPVTYDDAGNVIPLSKRFNEENEDIRYSLSSLSEAAGLTFAKKDGMTVLTDAKGKVIDEVTPEYLKKTPIGRLITLSNTRPGFNVMSDDAANARLKFMSDLLNMVIRTQDVDLIWAVSGTLGYDPAHLVDENTPKDKIKEKKSKFASITGNSDPQYKSTIDFTTICVKTQAIVDAMSELMKKMGRGLSEHEIIDIVYNETHMAGEQVPCPVCYVFSRWVGLGNLFTKIKEFQEDYPEGTDMSLIQEEYDQLQAEVGEMAERLDIKGGKARDILYKNTIQRQDELEEFKQLGTLTKEQKEELEQINRRLDVLDHWSWLGKTRLDPNYKPVPDEILFDINAGREFATEYPAVWKFRTTRGPSLGKAAAPYTPSRLGDTIRGIASPSSLKKIGEGSRPFLSKNLSKTAKKSFDNAVMNAKRQNRMNGQRLQSTSDFRFEYGLDYILSFIELEAIGAKAQMYTKVPEAVKFLASTMAEVNCSIMPLGKGVDENGNLIFSDVTGMSWEDALALSRAYDNVQPILVAIGREHLIAAMKNKDVTMIIPYHASGSSEGRYVSMMQTVGESVEDRTDFAEYENEHEIEDATPEQVAARKLRIRLLTGNAAELSEKDKAVLEGNEILRQLYIRVYGKDETGKAAKPDPKYVENFDDDGNDADCLGVYLTKDQANVMMPYEYWDKTSTSEQADAQGKAYQDYCESLGLTPVFSGWDAKGKYHEDMDFTEVPGYWKTLIDRCMYNNDGSYHKQSAINLDKVDLDMLDSEMMRDEVKKPLKVNDPAKTKEIVDKALARIEAEQAKFSISADLDKPYMDAVNSGNMDEAQRLVDEAAETAGYTIKAYHGTTEDFTKFSRAKWGENYKSYLEYGAGFYFTPNEEEAERWSKRSRTKKDFSNAKVMSVYLSSENAVGADDPVPGGSQALQNMGVEKANADFIANRTYRFINYLIEDKGFDNTEVQDELKSLGFDAVDATYNKKIGDRRGQFIVFDPEQIKSADPVTYAEDGSVIPLSERFDPNNDDIRYSLPTQDSDGNVLTDGQMEYFKNSQARDAEGKMQVVYHTTNRGGFTVFDPSYSDDRRSLFFASNWDVSQTYGRRADKPVDINRDDRDVTLEEFLDMDQDYGAPGLITSRLISLVDVETGEVLGDGDSFAEAGNLLTEWYNSKGENNPNLRLDIPYQPSGKDTLLDYDGFVSWMNDMVKEQGGLKQRGYYSCYLNLENPLTVDAKGAFWNSIPYTVQADEVSDWRRDDAYDKLNSEASKRIDRISIEQIYDKKGEQVGFDYAVYVSEKSEELDEWTHRPEWVLNAINGSLRLDKDSGSYEDFDDYIDDYNGLWGDLDEIIKDAGIPIDYFLNVIDEQADESGNIDYKPNNVTREDWITKDGRLLDADSYFEYTETYSTRQLAKLAQDQGRDGVIIRNCKDLGAGSSFRGNNEFSDIFIAFSSNQVKDTRNENPSENPDIRYSIPPEEEIKAHAAQRVENINEIPLSDPVLERNRLDHMTAEDAFIDGISDSWERRILNLDKQMGKTPLKNSLIGIMKQVRKGSNTDRQYKTETLNETIKSIKSMYKLARKNETEAFARKAWETAEHIVDDIDYNDALYQEYKEIKAFFDSTILAPGELWGDREMQSFASANSGKMRFTYHPINALEGNEIEIDQAYRIMRKQHPSFFTDEVSGPIEQLMQMQAVLDNTDAYRDAYTSEEHAKLVEEVANNLCNIVSEGKEFHASIGELNVNAMKLRHEEALYKVTERRNHIAEFHRERADMWKQKYQDRIKKEGTDRAEKKSRREHRKSFDRIAADYNDLCKWVLEPTKEKNVPEEFRKSLAEFLQTLDLQTENSKRLEEKTGRVANKTFKLRELKDRLRDLSESKTDADGNYTPALFEVDANVDFLLQKLADKVEKNGNTIDALDNEDIQTIEVFMKLLIRNIKRYKEVKLETKMAELNDIGERCVTFLRDKRDRDGIYGKREGLPGVIETINATALTPAYLFDRMGPLKEMYDVLRHNGFDTYIRNEKMIIDRMSTILSGYYKGNEKKPRPGSEIETWRDNRSEQTIELESGKTVTMTVAQMMSLYCLVNRGTQATDHMTIGGIVVTPIQEGSKIQQVKDTLKGKRIAETSQKRVLTETDMQNIIAKLTPEQIKIADQLQELMSTDMARLGNEAHRDLYGYNNFNDPNYFPIKVSGNELKTDINNIGDVVEKIKSYGPAKPVTPRAKNAIVIDDIFTVVADHCNGMNLYNAYLVPITDFMKVLNYTHTFEDGEVLTMKDAIEQAYGKDVLKYIMNLMKDINGIKADNRGGLESIMNKALGLSKKAAVFGNVRVALQQPTAIVRAAAEIDPKYFTGIKLNALNGDQRREVYEEMYKYCPIALWKSWGYYDTYMGRDIEDVMMNNWSMKDVALSGIYGALDNATWSGIWQAVKKEQMDEHPKMDHKSEEFLQMCGRRASEVFDKTQVVDSTFHRSDAMRNRQVAVKVFTAFMAEPTLTLNVFRAALFNASELRKSGDKAGATKVIARALGVLIAQAITVSAAQAFADAWRGKDPGLPWGDDDDDDDKENGYWVRWLHNFIQNTFDQLHLENNMYLIKDITPYINYMASKGADYWNWPPLLRAIMGWDQDYLYSQNNLIFASFENTANGVAQAFKKLEKGEEYDKRWYDILQKIASGIGNPLGFPAGTLMRDFKPIWDKIVPAAFAADEELLSSSSKGSESSESDKQSGSSSGSDSDSGSDSGTSESKLNEGPSGKYIKGYDKEAEKIASSVADKTGEEKEKATWEKVRDYIKEQEGASVEELVAQGKLNVLEEYRDMYTGAGNTDAYFDERIMDACKSEYKKTINYDQTKGAEWRQTMMRHFMTDHGMTDADVSAMVYKSETAKDLKVAMRIGDEGLIQESLMPLAQAGLTQDDLDKLWKNRNRVDLKKYKENGGRYADKLKSMGTFIWPTEGVITSHFGYRNSPTAGASSNHPAIDIGASQGTPVVAADGGVVIYAGNNGGYGNSVGIKHDNGMVTYYNHLYAWNVKVGDTVGQGQQIAQVGSTGISTGPHLDFKILDKDGKPVDPEKYLN